MKKIILSLAIAMSSHCSYAQTYLPLTAGGNNPLTGPLYINTSNDNWVTGLNIHNSANSNASRTGITLTNDANNILLLYKQASSNSDSNDNILYSAQGNFRLYTGGNEAIRVADNGNVGIGATLPGSTLQINGVTSMRTNTTTDGYISINPGSSSYQGYINWWKPGGTRVAYMGYTDGSTANNLALTLEASANFIVNGGNILIGKTSEQPGADYKLDIGGAARADKIVVNTSGADFVFDEKYLLPKLSDVKAYIDKNQHLPEIPSAKEMQTNGMSVGEINTKLLQKVEELTLYLIEKDKQDKEKDIKLSDQQWNIKSQQAQIDELREQLKSITKYLPNNRQHL